MAINLKLPRNHGSKCTRVEVNDKHAISLYANFCRVTGTPEELILDFGLNAQPFGVPTEPVDVKQRIVVNYFTAKRMLQALHMSVQRHEQAFGVLETDVQKRVVAAAAAARRPASQVLRADGTAIQAGSSGRLRRHWCAISRSCKSAIGRLTDSAESGSNRAPARTASS